jgi:hypothetical protein
MEMEAARVACLSELDSVIREATILRDDISSGRNVNRSSARRIAADANEAVAWTAALATLQQADPMVG